MSPSPKPQIGDRSLFTSLAARAYLNHAAISPLCDPAVLAVPLDQAEILSDMQQVFRAAGRANAAIYTIDPRGLVAGPEIDEQLETAEWLDYIRESQDSLRVLAEETGGIAVVNQNGFDQALKRIDAETSDYYVLGYYSSNPDPLQRTRRIEVRLKNRPGLNVWSRTSYTLRQPGPPTQQ